MKTLTAKANLNPDLLQTMYANFELRSDRREIKAANKIEVQADLLTDQAYVLAILTSPQYHIRKAVAS